jgi:hypothetical protein
MANPDSFDAYIAYAKRRAEQAGFRQAEAPQ